MQDSGPVPERLRQVFERMNLSPEEQERHWQGTIRRQNERHAQDEDYKSWLRENCLTDERYPTRMAAVNSGMEYADLGIASIEEEALACLTLDTMKRLNVIPVKLVGALLYVAVADVIPIAPLDEIQKAAGRDVVPVLASPQAIQYRISKHFAA